MHGLRSRSLSVSYPRGRYLPSPSGPEAHRSTRSKSTRRRRPPCSRRAREGWRRTARRGRRRRGLPVAATFGGAGGGRSSGCGRSGQPSEGGGGALGGGGGGGGGARGGGGVPGRRGRRRRGRRRRRWGRPAGPSEELERRRRIHVPLSEVSAAPLVLDEFDEGIVIVRRRRLVCGLHARSAESHVDQGRVRVTLVEHDDEGGLLPRHRGKEPGHP